VSEGAGRGAAGFLRVHGPLLAALAVVYAAGCLWLGPGVTDDTYIHLQYARNWAERGELAFNPGEPSNGATSPLWILSLALLRWLGLWGHDPVVAARALAWASSLGAILVLYTWAAGALGRRLAPAVAAALAVDAWLVRWASVGMETSLVVLCVLVALRASARAFASPRAAAGAGAACGLAALARPEALLLLPLVALSSLRAPRPPDLARRLGLFLGTFALVAGPWFVFARITTGTFLPLTAGAKSGGLHLSPGRWLAGARILAQTLASAQLLSALALLAGAATTKGRAFLLHPDRTVPLAWALALPAAYLVLDVQLLSRYLLVVTPVVTLLGFGAAAAARAGIRRPRPAAVLGGLAVLTAVQNALLLGLVVAPPTRAFSRDLPGSLGEMARWLRENTPAETVVATPDIGLIGFVSHRRVLDLGGLTSPAVARLREKAGFENMMSEGLFLDRPGIPEPDFLIDRDREPQRLQGKVLEGRVLRAIMTRPVANLGIRQPGPYHYTLYRIEPEPGGRMPRAPAPPREGEGT
jgi:hypothetical protein